MPVLKNAKHELFAQELAKGKGITEAYVAAGYSDAPAAATRLAKKVNSRAEEIKSEATRRVVDKLAITEERIMAEYARLGFSDIRKAVDWFGDLTTVEDNSEGGDVLVIKNVFSNHVLLKSAKDIDDDTAAAIAEVKQSPTGGLSMKMHPKLPALDAMAEHLGIKKPQKLELTGKDGAPIEVVNLTEAARRVAFMFQRAQRSKPADKPKDQE